MTDAPTGLTAKPLYQQVRERLVLRLIDGDWSAGDVIPSEIQLARELGVSQGTVRKALDKMVRDNILRRKQGRGTFVASSDDAEFVFQFFRLQPDGGERVLPESQVITVRRDKATAAVAQALDIARGTDTFRIERVRSLNDRPAISETVILVRALFDGFPTRDVPNNLYNLYAKRWGIRIGRTDEQLKAVSASETEAERLGCAPGTPLLRIERVARDLGGTPVELRLSNCLTDGLHYSAD